MVRTQLQLDEETYEALRRKAFDEHKSLSALAREILREGIGLKGRGRKRLPARLSFVGSGASGRDDISVRHDEALAEDFA